MWHLSWGNTDPSHICSVQFSHSVVSDSLCPHGLQHSRPPCPSPTPRVYSSHVYWVGDAIQPSHPLPSPSPPTFNLSQHQGLFQWVSSSHQVAKVLELQHPSFQWIFRADLLVVHGWDSQESSPSPQFESINSSAFSLLYLFFLFVVNFVIHWNETAMGLHVFPIPIPPPTSLSTRSL